MRKFLIAIIVLMVSLASQVHQFIHEPDIKNAGSTKGYIVFQTTFLNASGAHDIILQFESELTFAPNVVITTYQLFSKSNNYLL